MSDFFVDDDVEAFFQNVGDSFSHAGFLSTIRKILSEQSSGIGKFPLKLNHPLSVF
jgi:hypothetical protein